MTENPQAKPISFTLLLGATEVSDRDGISAAGADAASRRLTPKLDAEALLTGRTATGDPLPASPAGVTSPVVITRASLSLLQNNLQIVDCGCFSAPQTPHIQGAERIEPAGDFSLRDSLQMSQVGSLYANGKTLGLQADPAQLTVLAECVPGGTTTALAVLSALQIEAGGLLSSSIQGRKTPEKSLLVEAGLKRLDTAYGTSRESWQAMIRKNPLLAVAHMGDPMQAYAAGFITGALHNPNNIIVLAGGSQMLAVYALTKAVLEAHYPQLAAGAAKQISVVTTKWVAEDPFADTKSLARIIGAPYMASSISFVGSRHPGLRAYEGGHVKEGVGAGAAMYIAASRGTAERKIIETIDDYYEQMLGSAKVKS